MQLPSLQTTLRYLLLATLGQVLFGLGALVGYQRGYQQASFDASAPAEDESASVSVPVIESVADNGTLALQNVTSSSILHLADFLVVASHFKEDPTWLQKMTPYKHVIYTHRDVTVPKITHNLKGTHRVPNRGREATAYIKFILDQYDTLPPVVAFIHAHRKSWHQIDMVETLRHFLTVGDNSTWGYMSLNDATKPGGGVMKGWQSANVTKQTQPLTCYTEFSKGPNKEPRSNEYADLRKFWAVLYGQYLGPMPERIYQDCCAQFAVTRGAIRRWPKRFYQGLYDWLLLVDIPSERSGRLFEHMWRLVFAGPDWQPNPDLTMPC
eukprot:CAMPEP_0198231236 /NCGR_PEP_ID=MMETSP1445-20131203/115094_1 /TAXON_ID=36898 /ORGANISM="Pyramimonas sp., Strain CCMP2087" /LENGTH=323 /DNA_ID=CAMNT_0043911837 /DNA_START=150 /DNA_END=1121 /DNA_ORIENTATION=+